jgi:phage baseplate assembly protein W
MAGKSPRQTDKIYVDFPTNFDFHPIRKDLSLLVNEDAVKRSLRNIVLTNFYERNDPTVGANLTGQLFELATPQSRIVFEQTLRRAIENHEPRVQLISLQVAQDPDKNEVSATITFSIINTTEPITIKVLLTRVR